MVKEYREAEQKHTGYSTLRDSDVLKALVFLVRLANGRTSGRPKSRAFVEFLFTQFPEKESAVVARKKPEADYPSLKRSFTNSSATIFTDARGSNLFVSCVPWPCYFLGISARFALPAGPRATRESFSSAADALPPARFPPEARARTGAACIAG